MLGQPGSESTKLEEWELADSTLSLAHLLSDLPVPLMVLDTSGRITYVSPQAEAFLGRSTQECAGTALVSFTSFGHNRAADPSIFRALSRSLAGVPSRSSITFPTPRGPVEVKCALIPTLDDNGTPDGVLVMMQGPRPPEVRTEDPAIETSIKILARASSDIIGDADLEEIIQEEAARLVGSLGLDFVIFRLMTPDGRPLMLCHGIDPKDAEELMGSRTADGSLLYLEVCQGKSMILENATGNAGMKIGCGVRSLACLTIGLSNKAYGCAFFGVRGENIDLGVHYPLLQVFCNQVGISLRNAMLCRELEVRNNELRSLNKTSRALSSTLELQRVLHTILHHAMALVDAENCFIFELNPVRERLRLISTINRMSVAVGLELELGKGITGQVAQTGKGKLLEMTDLDPLYDPPFGKLSPATVICVPLKFSDKLLGVMTLVKSPEVPFTRKQYGSIEVFSLQAAIALHNASLFEKARSYASDLRVYNVLLTHDVANFNAPIHGFLEMLLKDPGLDDRQRRYVHSALVQSENISELISSVREMSQLRSKLGEMPLEPVDLIQEIILAKENIFSNVLYENIEITVSSDVPKAEVMADALLRDLFYNLLSNACKYGGCRPVEVRVTEERSGEQECWKVRIADGGRGIPDEVKVTLFKRFDNLDSVQGSDGHGLGLSVVGALCERYGGKVWAEDRVPGDHTKGSVFTVTLPKRRSVSG